MPLSDGYGVVVGSVSGHCPEPEDTEGQWFHYLLWVETRHGEFRCGINLRARNSVEVQWREVVLPRQRFAPLLDRPRDFYELSPSRESGALDLAREADLKGSGQSDDWPTSDGRTVMDRLRVALRRATRVLVFGEPYFGPVRGLHNVHMNQGDPLTRRQATENGIWQDGAIVCGYRDRDEVTAFAVKFQTQTFDTDDRGRPRAAALFEFAPDASRPV